MLLDTVKTYYSQDNIIVREATLTDVDTLKMTMKQADIDEIKASHGHTPEQALLLSLKESTIALTVEFEGECVAIFGVCSEGSLVTDQGVIWLLSSEKLFTHALRFVRHSREFVDLMLTYNSFLYNFIDSRNAKSIAWLKWLGATFYEAEPYGIDQLPFHLFYFKRGQL